MKSWAGTARETQRVDKWLVYARFCKTRSQAAALVIDGKIRINGRKIEKPDAKLHKGDVLTLANNSSVQLIKIVELAERRGSPDAAHAMYEILPQNTGTLEKPSGQDVQG
jgi:ribosome-associated heat shock protein Hsp15